MVNRTANMNTPTTTNPKMFKNIENSARMPAHAATYTNIPKKNINVASHDGVSGPLGTPSPWYDS